MYEKLIYIYVKCATYSYIHAKLYKICVRKVCMKYWCIYVNCTIYCHIYANLYTTCVWNVCMKYECPTHDMWYRRLIGCLELQVIFRKRATNSRALLYVWNMSVQHMTCGTGWRRLIGCFKLQVIFRTRATNYRALLRKMTYEDKASCDSTPPCIHIEHMYIACVCISRKRAL